MCAIDDALGKAKVDKLDVADIVEEDVLRLDVAVDDMLVFEVLQCKK